MIKYLSIEIYGVGKDSIQTFMSEVCAHIIDDSFISVYDFKYVKSYALSSNVLIFEALIDAHDLDIGFYVDWVSGWLKSYRTKNLGRDAFYTLNFLEYPKMTKDPICLGGG